MVPFYLFSQKELAPNEDQSVVFGIVQAAPNATLDQTKLFASKVHDVYRAFPEAESIFQITSPAGGFGGLVTKPWDQRQEEHRRSSRLKRQRSSRRFPACASSPPFRRRCRVAAISRWTS